MYVKVIRSRSRSQQQKACLCILVGLLSFECLDLQTPFSYANTSTRDLGQGHGVKIVTSTHVGGWSAVD